MPQVHAVIQAGDLPNVERVVQQLVDAGIRRITVVIAAQGASVRARVLRLLTTLPPLDVAFFEDPAAPGDAGVLGEIGSGDDEVLLCFADPVTDIDVATLLAVHRERRHDVTLASHHELHQLTLAELEADGDRVRGCQEKPREVYLVGSGIAVLGARAMAVVRALPCPYGVSKLVTEVLAAGCSVTHWLHGACTIDVDTPELLDRARGDAPRAAGANIGPIIRRQAG